MRLPPLNALRAFEASARHRSFTRAAEELHVTPAAISHQIKGLEEALGASLFHRARGTLMLTDAGQKLLPGVRRGFQAFEEAVQSFGRLHQSGLLTVAVTPSFAVKWLVPRLEHFNHAHPEIDIRISTKLDLLDYEREGVEIGIRYGRGDYPGLVVEKLLSYEVSPVCSPRLIEGTKRLDTPEDLKDFTLLHDDSPFHDDTHPDWAMWLKAAGVTTVDPSHGLRFDTAGACLNAAIEGVGVALGRTALAAQDIVAGRLIRPFALGLPSEFAYFVVYSESSIRRPKVKAFRDWLFDEVRQIQKDASPTTVTLAATAGS